MQYIFKRNKLENNFHNTDLFKYFPGKEGLGAREQDFGNEAKAEPFSVPTTSGRENMDLNEIEKKKESPYANAKQLQKVHQACIFETCTLKTSRNGNEFYEMECSSPTLRFPLHLTDTTRMKKSHGSKTEQWKGLNVIISSKDGQTFIIEPIEENVQ